MSKDDIHYLQLVKQKPLKLNDAWYIMDRDWYNNWCKSIHNHLKIESLEKISNSRLLVENEVNKVVIEKIEYELVPEEVWNYLVSKHGLDCSNSELFRRNVIEIHNTLSVEVELLKLTISIYGKENKTTEKFSCCKILNDIYEFAIEKFAVKRPLRILQKMDNGEHDVVKLDGTVTLRDAGFSSGEHIYIDYQDTDGQWMNTKLKQKSHNKSFASGNSRQNDGRVQGVCGLCNLGNTCFMNSAIQCISNVPPLTYYFIKTDWKSDLNITNPLGMHGRLAECYYQLLEQMWVKGSNYTVPRDFKVEVAKFAPQFSGYAQHDSQELMMFLLDGLHEDLNRIQKKPYQECADSDEKSIQQKALEAWNYHKMRNDSAIVENFHGLLKSTVVCPDCSYVSVTFDAFGSLSLPLVASYPQPFHIKFFSAQKNIQKAKILITKSETIKDINDRIKLMFPEVNKSFLTFSEIQSHRITRDFHPQDSVSLLKDVDDLMVYELPHHDNKEEWFRLHMHVIDENQFFGCPIMVSMCKTEIDWYSIKNRLFQRFPFMNKILGSKSSVGYDLDAKFVKLEYDKVSAVFNIYLNDKNTQKSRLIDQDFSETTLPTPGRYELSLEWTKEGKEKYYDPHVEHVVCHESANLQHRPLNIENCVNEFIKTEKLGINDLWYCKKCKGQKAATKKFDLWQLPKVLILHLKRFRSGSYRRDKIDTFVEFPLTDLDLSSFVDEAHRDAEDKGFQIGDDIYDLVAVSNHMGGLGGGHYTAFAKNFIDSNWYLFDDSHTSQITPEAVQTKTAYVLVYVSKSMLKHTRDLLNQHLNEDSLMEYE